MMTDYWNVLVDGVVLSASLTAVILASLAYNPRIWINDAPPQVRALAPPLSVTERRARAIAGVVMLLTFLAVTAWSAARLLHRYDQTLPLAAAVTHFLGVFFLFNLVDLLVIDWFVLLVLRPSFLMRLSAPGLTYDEIVGGYGYHFRGFVIGIGFVTVGGLVAAVLTWLADTTA